MPRPNDPQTRRDTDEQHGYGETDREEKPLKNEPSHKSSALGEPDEEEHGFLRDDGQGRPVGSRDKHLDTHKGPVISSDDERHPILPDMADDDIGPKEADVAEEPEADRQILKDAYSANKPEEEVDEAAAGEPVRERS